MRVRRLALLFLAITLAAPSLAEAQLDLRVLDGGKPKPDVPVTSLLDPGNPGSAGTTNDDGAITIPADRLVPKGTRVAVWVRQCQDGRVAEVILAPADQPNACMERDAQAGDDCDCDETPFIFVMGDGPVTIDTGTRTVTQGGTGTSVGGPTIGAKFNLSNMFKLQDVAGEAEGAIGSEATTWAPGGAFFVETRPFSFPLSLGVAGTYATMETETQFNGDVQTGDIKYYSVGPYARMDLGRGFRLGMGLVPFLEAGLMHAWNKGDFRMDGESEERDHTAWRGEFGGGLYHFSTPSWGMIFQALYSTTGKDGDADEHVRIGAGILWKPRARSLLIP